MTRTPKIDLKRAIKYSWIATNISLLQLGIGSYALHSDYAFTNNDALLYLVFLSFPSSIPAVVFSASFIQGYPPMIYPPFDYIVIGFVAFISGYLQWFWFIPRIMQKPQIISLELRGLEETRPVTVTNPTPRRKRSRSKVPAAPFDKTGHSPLERAIGIKRGQVNTGEVTNVCGKTWRSSRRQSLSRAFHPSCNDRREARQRRAADRNVVPQQ